MFLGFSRFTVANEMGEDVAEAFLQRPHLVDDAPGFVRMEVVRDSEQPDEFWLLTWWRDAESFETWFKSPAHRASHIGIPKGLRIVPGSAEVRRLTLVTD
ncbi:MAG: antibiotic biosynthesis monooxygenase [Rhodocyclales bacterium]|nr:antibiotic biosynthesis monooxygenase [Rhodocyclales bacterium]